MTGSAGAADGPDQEQLERDRERKLKLLMARYAPRGPLSAEARAAVTAAARSGAAGAALAAGVSAARAAGGAAATDASAAVLAAAAAAASSTAAAPSAAGGGSAAAVADGSAVVDCCALPGCQAEGAFVCGKCNAVRYCGADHQRCVVVARLSCRVVLQSLVTRADSSPLSLSTPFPLHPHAPQRALEGAQAAVQGLASMHSRLGLRLELGMAWEGGKKEARREGEEMGSKERRGLAVVGMVWWLAAVGKLAAE